MTAFERVVNLMHAEILRLEEKIDRLGEMFREERRIANQFAAENKELRERLSPPIPDVFQDAEKVCAATPKAVHDALLHELARDIDDVNDPREASLADPLG